MTVREVFSGDFGYTFRFKAPAGATSSDTITCVCERDVTGGVVSIASNTIVTNGDLVTTVPADTFTAAQAGRYRVSWTINGTSWPAPSDRPYLVVKPDPSVNGVSITPDQAARFPTLETTVASIDTRVADIEANGVGGGDGAQFLSGVGAPSSQTGTDGDFYIDTATTILYGPKANGAWPAGVSLQGQDGADGVDGAPGSAGADGGGTGQALVLSPVGVDVATGTDVAISWYAPQDFTLTDVYAWLEVPGTTPTQVDVKVNGTSIMSSPVVIDANEATSRTAATPPVIATPILSQNDRLSFDIDVAGNGAQGLIIWFGGTTQAAQSQVTVPGTPTGLGIFALNTNQLSLFWTAPSDGGSTITNYRVQRDIGAGFITIATPNPSGAGSNQNWSDPAPPVGVVSTYRVAAINAVGISGYSNTASGTAYDVPDAPTNLTATPGNLQNSLSWSAPDPNGAAITDYTIEVSTNGGATWSTIDKGGASTNTAFVHTGLTNGTTYTYRVSAVNVGGTGPASATANGTPATGASAPSAPTGLIASPLDTRVDLEWTGSSSNGGSDILRYELQRSTNGGSTWSSPINVTWPTTTYSDTGLTNGTTYTYRVRAVNSAPSPNSPYSNTASATPVAATTAPSTPPSVTATPGNQQAFVQWGIPTDLGGLDIDRYRVQRRVGPTGTFTFLANIIPPNRSLTDTGLTNGVEYAYQVRAENAVGNSAYGGPATATPLAAPTVPGAPSGLIATPGDAEVSLQWSAPADTGGAAITDYLIEVDELADGSFASFADGISTNEFATVTSLINGTLYAFRVSAINSVGTGPASAPVTATPATSATTPAAPQNFTLTPGNTTMQLDWVAPTTGQPSRYRIERDSGEDYTFITNVAGNVTTFTDSSLTNGTVYGYRVRAENLPGPLVGPFVEDFASPSAASPSRVGSPFYAAGAASPATATIDLSSAQAGDELYVFVSNHTTLGNLTLARPTAPAGWTTVGETTLTSNSYPKARLFRRTLTGSEGAAYNLGNFTFSGSSGWAIFAIVMRDAGTPWVVTLSTATTDADVTFTSSQSADLAYLFVGGAGTTGIDESTPLTAISGPNSTDFGAGADVMKYALYEEATMAGLASRTLTFTGATISGNCVAGGFLIGFS